MTDLQRTIEGLGPWFHNLHLPDGTQTRPDHPLGDFPRTNWDLLAPHLPDDVAGATVLDVGCNAGFYTLELARRGAHVTALDVDDRYLRQARWAAEQWGVSSQVEFVHAPVYSLAGSARRWDIVLFLGVLYHLRYPMLGVDIVSRCTRRLLALQCLSAPGGLGLEPPKELPLRDREPLASRDWPKLSFIEYRLADDPTNWWAPNPACVEAMLRTSGLRVVGRPAQEFLLCEPDPGLDSNMWTWNEGEFWAAVGGRPQSEEPAPRSRP